MKKLVTLLFAVALISAILSQITVAGYGGGYGSISGTSGGTPGANTALSNLASVAVSQDLVPGTSYGKSLGSSSLKWLEIDTDYMTLWNQGTGHYVTLNEDASSSDYAWTFPASMGSSGQVLTSAGTGATPTWTTDVRVYNASGTAQTASHIVQDTCTLGTSCSITLTGASVFTNSTSYTCLTQDDTGIFATKCDQTSGSALVITGNGTDVIRYVLVGN